ncbi:unnamed protein product [Soboliphyme baturini]|uniref:GDT1 family protein n=1 Tax=Soboliphyme baturini TaxID=241478 RepID=A0A183ILT1_9BILA|nr:unnamed protein product [Soboliphyme baturini]
MVKDAKSIAKSSLGYWHAFVASISVIIVSELGDKTFFIAAILSMKHSRLIVFCGAMSALFLMTVLSSCFGWATQIIPRMYTFYFSTALFAFFGIKMLRDAYLMTDSDSMEEFEAAEVEVKKRGEMTPSAKDLEAGVVIVRRSTASVRFLKFISSVFLEAFTLTFIAEWGDRSQIATIILAARENVVGVTLGGTLGHSLCTGLAVLGGRMVSRRISVKTGKFCE